MSLIDTAHGEVMHVAFLGEFVFFPKRRCGRIKNGCVYGKKACDCDFAILNFYCHRGIPENCFVEKSLGTVYIAGRAQTEMIMIVTKIH